jgi:hypothetical protein
LTRDRVLVWDGCVNVRDLGGLPLEDGGETRFRVVVRADSIRGLTNKGWAALREYGFGTVIDLRGDAEVAQDPPAPVPVTRCRSSRPKTGRRCERRTSCSSPALAQRSPVQST